jgi:hypothetical protein
MEPLDLLKHTYHRPEYFSKIKYFEITGSKVEELELKKDIIISFSPENIYIITKLKLLKCNLPSFRVYVKPFSPRKPIDNRFDLDF